MTTERYESKPRISPKYVRLAVLLTASLILVGVAGCRDREKQTVFNTRLPDDATHLDLHWPSIRDETPAVHFRIPREDLDLSRLRGDKPGEIDRVHVKFRIPDAGGLRRKMFDAINGETGGRMTYNAGVDAWSWVALRRSPNDGRARKVRYDQWRYNCKSCAPDGTFGDLTRYSELFCPSKPHKPYHIERLAQKPQDDPSPEGCVLQRPSAYLSNSTEKDLGDTGVDVWCSTGNCSLYVQVSGREIYTRIHSSQLAYATEFAAAIRAQFSTYIAD